MAATTLLDIPEARRAAEVRRAEVGGLAHRVSRRRLRILVVVCFGWLLAGIGLLGLSFHLTDDDRAQAALLAALLVGDGGPLFTLLLAHWWDTNR
ncbi:MAG: hypothetical protein ACREMJ_08175 [Gemmatimonadales bacterium]